ncbi:hypothetical protein KBD61_06325 [Patescibacteria group bacterium]|nr:hypothetical protein [Patescibacteria group bacterium]MBP9710603.1 hypothetical protein [Patescibacteria group bacterium]
MINPDQVKSLKWQLLAARRESLLFKSLLERACVLSPEVTGLNWQITAIFRPGADIFLLSEEMEALRQELREVGVKGLMDFHAKLLMYMHTLDDQMAAWEVQAPSLRDKDELRKAIETFFDLFSQACPFLIPLPVADGVLSQNILQRLPAGSEEEKQGWLKVLTYPVKDNEHTREERAFYALVEAVMAKDVDVDERIRAHVKEFAWIGSRGGWWELAWTETDVRERIEQFIVQKKDPQEELRQLNLSRLERQESGVQLYKQLDIQVGSELDKWIQLAKEFAYIRTWRTDVVYRALHRAQFLFVELARRIGVDVFDLCYFTSDEVRESLETEQSSCSSEEIARRRVFFGSLFLEGVLDIVSGEEGRAFIQSLIELPSFEQTNEVKGSIAFQGHATGKVKIVLTGHDLKHVERGDVLIAVMTFPNFIAAMEKACAFVTDEGGILCHAAIVSREMRKPCVIATKKATKVFKDGDIVEVDADKGIVRKV